MRAKDLRVLVVTTESRMSANWLWYAAEDYVSDLRIVGPDLPGERPRADQVLLRPLGPRPEMNTYRRLAGYGREVDRFKPDLVHLNNELWAVNCLQQVMRREPFVVHGAENLFLRDRPIPWIRTVLSRMVAKRISGYASWNRPGVDAAEQFGPPELPTLVLPAVIPPPPFRDPNSAWRYTRTDVFDVICIGRLDQQKGFDRLIRAIGSLADSDKYRLHICGTGDEEAALRTLSHEQGVNSVFHGWIGSDELAGLMSQMGCLVQPSLTTPGLVEQFGRAVAEAMTIGLPCIVSSSGELPLVVGDDECVYPESDVSALADRLESFRMDRSLLMEKSEQQRIRSRQWSGAVAGEAVAEFWRRSHEYAQARRGVK